MTPRRSSGERGQSLVEMALVLPLAMVMVFGVVEVSYALLDQHVVAKITREGSNLISRDVSLQAASTAIKTMSSRPVDFDSNSKLIFTVLRKVSTTGSANFDRIVLYQRHEFGALTGPTSKIKISGSGSFNGAPDYQAVNPDNNTGLRVTPASLPAGLDIVRGGMLYVTEIYTTHTLLTPLDRLPSLSVALPTTLYSIAYF